MQNKSKVEIKKSKLSGQGLFTTKSIKKEQVVLEIKGKLLSIPTFFKITQKERDNTIRFSKNQYLSPAGYPANFLNHSCTPNCKLVKKGKKLFLVSLTNIRKGEELTFDYATNLAKDDFWLMKCTCKMNCRGVMKRYSTLPKKTLEEYIKKSMIPAYILKIEY